MSDLGNRTVMAANLRRLMESAGKDRNALCRDLDLKYSTVSEWLNATAYPRIDKIELMAHYFGVQKSDLVEEYVPTASKTIPAPAIGLTYHPSHRIPILGRVSAGLPLYADQNIEGYTMTDLNGGQEYFALRVKGDSMNAARICDGDLIIVCKQDVVENGQIAVVMVDGDDATVKRFRQDGNTVTLIPQSYNPAHAPQIYNLKETPIKVIGKVVKVEYTIDGQML